MLRNWQALLHKYAENVPFPTEKEIQNALNAWSQKPIKKKKIDFVEAYLIELSLLKQLSIYTNDESIIKTEAQTIQL